MLDLRLNREEARKDSQTRELINTLESFPEYSRRYWIGKLVKQGQLSEGRAGKLLVIMGLI